MKGFKEAVALQASTDQVNQFRRMINKTQAARKGANDLGQLAGNATHPDLSRTASPLAAALKEAQVNTEAFVQSFSEAQRSGLRDATKRLEKTHSEVMQQSKALIRTLERSTVARKQITDAAAKLDAVLGAFESRQLAMGLAMGIQGEEASQ